MALRDVDSSVQEDREYLLGEMCRCSGGAKGGGMQRAVSWMISRTRRLAMLLHLDSAEMQHQCCWGHRVYRYVAGNMAHLPLAHPFDEKLHNFTSEQKRRVLWGSSVCKMISGAVVTESASAGETMPTGTYLLGGGAAVI